MASYILTYDVGTSLAIHQQLSAFVKDNRHVSQWAQPFVGCFLLKSDAGLLTLSASFSQFFAGNTQHVLSLIQPHETAGILSQAIWDWFNRPEESALAGLLANYGSGGIAPHSGG